MRRFVFIALGVLVTTGLALSQTTFEVTGTPIPANLLQQNYGSVPKGITAYDLNICNVTDTKQSVVSSRIYQALSQSNTALQPIGRDIMLAAILRNQSHNLTSILNVALMSATGVLSVLGTSKFKLPGAFTTGAALASFSGQQILSNLRPILSADQVEKFENQVLEPALVLDGGSCIERTVFTITAAAAKAKSAPLNFRMK
jgi:hypothetical protein